VIFTGQVTQADLIAAYRSSQAFLCLSEHEGFCVPLLEAMHFCDGSELRILSRGATYAYRWESTYGLETTYIPVGNRIRRLRGADAGSEGLFEVVPADGDEALALLLAGLAPLGLVGGLQEVGRAGGVEAPHAGRRRRMDGEIQQDVGGNNAELLGGVGGRLFPDCNQFAIECLGVAFSVLAADGEFKEVEEIRDFGRRLDKDGRCAGEGGKALVEFLVHGGIEGVAGAEEYGVNMLILVQVRLVEGEFAVGRFGFAHAPDGVQPFGAQVGEDVFHPPEAVGAWFDLESDFHGGLDELILNLPRQEAAFLGLHVGFLEAGEVHVGAGERDAGRLLVTQ
jgi:hypothetical protein